MNASERAESLRAQADAAEQEAALEDTLVKAKDRYRSKQTDKNKQAKAEAAQALREHREMTRASTGTTVGGDAFPSGEGE